MLYIYISPVFINTSSDRSSRKGILIYLSKLKYRATSFYWNYFFLNYFKTQYFIFQMYKIKHQGSVCSTTVEIHLMRY